MGSVAYLRTLVYEKNNASDSVVLILSTFLQITNLARITTTSELCLAVYARLGVILIDKYLRFVVDQRGWAVSVKSKPFSLFESCVHVCFRSESN